jgi:hypothetical protein
MSTCQHCGKRKGPTEFIWCTQCRRWLQYLASQRVRGRVWRAQQGLISCEWTDCA